MSLLKVVAKQALKAPAVAKIVARTNYTSTHVTTPPRNKVSPTVLYTVGTGMCLSLLIVPGWVLYHLEDYKAPK